MSELADLGESLFYLLVLVGAYKVSAWLGKLLKVDWRFTLMLFCAIYMLAVWGHIYCESRR